MLRAPDGEDLASFCRRYNARCNAHTFTGLDECVADDVAVNGQVQGLRV